MVLDNRIVFYQISAEKGDICCDQSPHYVYINVTSEVKIYLDRSMQLVTWPQLSPEVPDAHMLKSLEFPKE